MVATLPLALIPALNGLGWHSLNAASLNTNLVIALITLVVITVLNIYGVKLVSIINNTGVVFEILGMFVFALVLMAFHNHQGFSVVTNSAGIPVNGSTFLAAFIIGGVFLLGTLVAIPNMGDAVKGAFGPAAIIEANFSTPFATIYLLVVSAAIFVCCLSIMAATIRLCFGMARDNQLPGSSFLAKVSPNLHTPVWSCIAVACIAAIPFWQYSGAGIIAIAATGMIYLSYFLGNIVIMRARLRGWPRVSAPFRLGRWGMLVNVVALLYGGAMLVNFAWPRAASNPKPNQTGGLLKLGFLDGVPILWIVVIFIALVGAVYYLIVGRTKRFAPVVAPSEDDAPFAGSGV